QKTPEGLVREAGEFISLGGYREISLASLSSGDYSSIGELADALNERFSGKHVSFQLPSLRVSTFSLSLLEKISQTRRSRLTFAVETPRDFWQLAINKQVTADSVVEIIREAKRHGWRGAKFYFMIGLPLPETPGADAPEEEEIVSFISNIAKRTAMHFNVNVGIFVPKPHTPYQWARQIDGETAAAKLDFIRSRLRPQGHKVSVSDPLVSTLEGILSRGDERAGMMAERAFYAGSRLDAWQEFINKDAWREILAGNAEPAGEFLAVKDASVPPPWHSIVSGVSAAYLRKEFEKSLRGEMTPPCAEDCGSRCGVCHVSEREGEGEIGSDGKKRVGLSICSNHKQRPPFPVPRSPFPVPQSPVPDPQPPQSDPAIWRLLFSFAKEGGAVFHGHLNLIEIFSMAMGRAGLDVLYTQGFNPLAKLEIVSPLSVGISARAEMAAVDFAREIPPHEFLQKMNAALPEGIKLNRAEIYRIPSGGKKRSLSSLLWGFAYGNSNGETDYIPASGEKAYRGQCLSAGGTNFSLCRASVLAKNSTEDPAWASYFDVYRQLYGK
ncbi:MAG: TIGR03936 family radical SAM-associated protein, partial [Treponema sp.]|nr:TIGR03936 family radical SAM-associated protein [Treponema sp.]